MCSKPRQYGYKSKAEVKCLSTLSVLKQVNCSEWASPSVIAPKANGTVKFINDFREQKNKD